MNDSPQNGWTLGAYIAHNEALRVAEEKLQLERDRRYTEVKNAEEKALKIKEEADKTALGLQRDNQLYRDEKANELREQISSERGLYVRNADLAGAIEKVEATVKPLADYVASQSGPRALTAPGILAGVAAIGVIATLWYSTHRTTAPVAPTPTVVCSAVYHPAPCPS